MSIQEIRNETAGNSSEQKLETLRCCVIVTCSSRTYRLIFLFFTRQAAFKCRLRSHLLFCSLFNSLEASSLSIAPLTAPMTSSPPTQQLCVPPTFSLSAKAKLCFPSDGTAS